MLDWYTSNDELSEIAVTINKMSDDLKESLLNKNDLQKQVKERSTELQSKIDEIQRTNKLLVDREIKMVELKKEIEELKNK